MSIEPQHVDEHRADDTAVRVRGLDVRLPAPKHPYAEPIPVLRGLSFDAPRGQVTAIVGSNGAGKTTALRAIIGALPSSGGQIAILGSPMTGVEDALPSGVAVVPDAPMVPGSWSADDLARLLRGTVESFDVRDFGRRLRRHGIDPGTSVRDLSRGQATWFGISAALATSPRLLIADEPLARLDPLARRDLVDLLRGCVADGASILLSTHDLEGMDRFVDHLVVVDAGRTVLEGDVETLRDSYLDVEIPREHGDGALHLVMTGLESAADTSRGLVHVDDAALLPSDSDLRRPTLADLVTAHLREARASTTTRRAS